MDEWYLDCSDCDQNFFCDGQMKICPNTGDLICKRRDIASLAPSQIKLYKMIQDLKSQVDKLTEKLEQNASSG